MFAPSQVIYGRQQLNLAPRALIALQGPWSNFEIRGGGGVTVSDSILGGTRHLWGPQDTLGGGGGRHIGGHLAPCSAVPALGTN